MSQELIKMEKKLQKIYLCITIYQIIFLKKFIKLNVNTTRVIETCEINISIVTVFLKTQSLKNTNTNMNTNVHAVTKIINKSLMKS